VSDQRSDELTPISLPFIEKHPLVVSGASERESQLTEIFYFAPDNISPMTQPFTIGELKLADKNSQAGEALRDKNLAVRGT